MRERARIEGKGWKVFISEEVNAWDYQGDGGFVPCRMLNDHYSRDDIIAFASTTVILSREYGTLYTDAESFLNGWGFKCRAVGLTDIVVEAPPPPD
jgi:hypothetical protein